MAAKATFIKSARKDIYVNGKQVELIHQKGKHAGEKYCKIDKTQPRDENDKILIHKGESYWTWCFMHQTPRYSKTKPRPSQLTNSSFLSSYYGIQEQVEDFAPSRADEIQEFIDDVISQLEELRDECQDSLDNMPESLQYSSNGELLQERIDECDNLISEFEGIDTEYIPEDDDDNEEEQSDDENEISEEEQEWIDDVVAEIQDICFNL